MRENNKKEDYIVIDKKKIENYFFVSVLVIALIIFLVFLVKGFTSMTVESDDHLHNELISYYNDENLNVYYPIPGGDWVMGQVEDEDVVDVLKESSGEDNYFDINTDVLTSEILSTIFFNEEGLEGYRQFMSFTFKPLADEYLDYCIASFERDLKNSGDGTYKDYQLLSAVEDENNGVMLKAILTEEVKSEADDIDGEFPLYYTQYVQRIGKNIATVTFGSIAEDDTVDKYLKYFLNNIQLINSVS